MMMEFLKRSVKKVETTPKKPEEIAKKVEGGAIDTIKGFFGDKFNKLMGRNTRLAAALLVGITAASCEKPQTVDIVNNLDYNTTINFDDQESKEKKDRDLHLYSRTFYEDENGQKKFNLGSLIAPIGFEYHMDQEIKNTNTVNIGMEYAEMFDHFAAKDSADYKKVEEYVRKEITRTIGSHLIQLDVNKIYNSRHEGDENIRGGQFNVTDIDTIKITGFTSPEAGSGQNPATFLPGNPDDAENLELGMGRAQKLAPHVLEVLADMGYDTSRIEVEFSAEEVQFTDQEIDTLLKISNQLGYGGVNDVTSIENLIIAYNDGLIKNNPEIQKELDTIIGAKRSVQVEITSTDKKKRQVEVLLPITLLLLGFIPYLKRKLKPKDKEPVKPDKPEPEIPEPEPKQKTPKRIFSESVYDMNTIDSGEYNFYTTYENADAGIDSRDKSRIRNQFITEELYTRMDDEQAIQNGLDYRQIIIETASRYAELYPSSRYDIDNQFRTDIAQALLDAWQKHDRKIMDSIDIQHMEQTLEYKNDPMKVLWAKIAAEDIARLAMAYRNDPNSLDQEIFNNVKKAHEIRDAEIAQALLNNEKEMNHLTIGNKIPEGNAKEIVNPKPVSPEVVRSPEIEKYFEMNPLTSDEFLDAMSDKKIQGAMTSAQYVEWSELMTSRRRQSKEGNVEVVEEVKVTPDQNNVESSEKTVNEELITQGETTQNQAPAEDVVIDDKLEVSPRKKITINRLPQGQPENIKKYINDTKKQIEKLKTEIRAYEKMVNGGNNNAESQILSREAEIKKLEESVNFFEANEKKKKETEQLKKETEQLKQALTEQLNTIRNEIRRAEQNGNEQVIIQKEDELRNIEKQLSELNK